MVGATKDMTRSRVTVGGIAVVLGGSAAAWAVAYPQAVPRRAGAPLALAAGFWLLAELCRLVVGAAGAAAVPVTRLGLVTTLEFTVATSAGRSGLFSVVAAGLVVLVALVAPRTPPVAIAVAGIAAVGLAARTIGGHMSASSLGAVAIAIHALAAAMWCGTLAALVLTVDHRDQWARVLAAVLRAVAVMRDYLAGRWRDRCARRCGFGGAVVRHRVRPSFADQDRAHDCVEVSGLA